MAFTLPEAPMERALRVLDEINESLKTLATVLANPVVITGSELSEDKTERTPIPRKRVLTPRV